MSIDNTESLDKLGKSTEVNANKVQDLSSPSTSTYLSTQGLQTYMDTEVLIKIESFSNFNARFFGEVGKPVDNTPAWVEDEPTRITLENQVVLGATKQVVKFKDDIAASAVGAEIPLVTADWTNINSFGASYGGTMRLDSIDNGGFFLGLQDNDVDKRYGFNVIKNGSFVKLNSPDSGSAFSITLDGLSGRPKILFDEWFKIEIVIPVGLGNADVYINGELLDQQIVFATNEGGGGSKATITSGSSAATNRTFYVADYGVTIYKESSTKTISSVSMNAKNFLVLIPPGKRDYALEFPAGITRKIGNRFAVLAENVNGKVKFTTNPPDPLITFEGLRTISKNVEQVRMIRYVNTINNANNYEHDHQHPTRKIQLDGTLGLPGDISYNTTLKVFEGKGLDTTLQFGQESHVPVVNKTGGTLNEGDVVFANGYDATVDRLTITKSLADKLVNARVLGVCTTNMVDGEEGKITTFGRVNGLDTSGFTQGERIYLSASVVGGFTATKPTLITVQVGYIGKVDVSVGYIEVDIKELPLSLRAVVSDTTDQTFTANVSKAIDFNTNDTLNGMSHSTTVDKSEVTINNDGIYRVTAKVHYTRATGGTDELNMYIQREIGGGGFTNIANSNTKVNVITADLKAVASLIHILKFNTGDKIRIMIQVAHVDLKLDASVAFGSSPNDVPATPSAILAIDRIGD